jgi:hypothetical protein
MSETSGAQENRRRREAVEREMQRRRDPEERDLRDTVAEEQQRERARTDREDGGDGEA